MIDKTKVCRRCGKEYQPTGRNQKYCEECGYSAEREKHRLSNAVWMKTHPEKCRKWVAIFYKANREKVLKSVATWQKANPEANRLHFAKRRSLKYGNTPHDKLLTPAEWLAILAEYNGHCAYCSKKAKLTLDHVIPLSKGGKHSKDNVVPACRHCNSSKGAKTPEERFGMGIAS